MRISANLGLLLTLLCAPALAQDASSAELQRLLGSLSTFTADFEQRIVDPNGEELQRSSGRVFFAGGNRFQWRTDKPWAQLLISDGDTLWHYEEDLEQVVVRPFDARLQQTPALLLGGDVDALEQAFMVDALVVASPAELPGFSLQPKDDNSLFSKLEIRFDHDLPMQLVLVDDFGQRTEIRFTNAASQVELDPALFHFTPPDGVDVLRDD